MSNQPHVLSVQSGGVVQGLFTECIALGELGPLQLTRASTIEFNPTTQQWEVGVPASEQVLFRDPSRQRCLDWEQSHFNTQLLSGSSIHPTNQQMTHQS